MITGIDLVKEQIKVARGEKLSFTQEDLQIKGHAIEVYMLKILKTIFYQILEGCKPTKGQEV